MHSEGDGGCSLSNDRVESPPSSALTLHCLKDLSRKKAGPRGTAASMEVTCGTWLRTNFKKTNYCIKTSLNVPSITQITEDRKKREREI